MALRDARIEHMAFASCGVGGHFRIAMSIPYIM